MAAKRTKELLRKINRVVYCTMVVHNGAVLLTEMAAKRTHDHAHDLLRKISRVSHLAPPALYDLCLRLARLSSRGARAIQATKFRDDVEIIEPLDFHQYQ